MDPDRIEEFERLVEQEPQSEVARYSLAKAYFEAHRHQEAADQLRETLSQHPGCSPAFLLLGRCLLRMGQREEARRIFRRGIEVARERGDVEVQADMLESLASTER